MHPTYFLHPAGASGPRAVHDLKLNRGWVMQQHDDPNQLNNGLKRRGLMFWNGQLKPHWDAVAWPEDCCATETTLKRGNRFVGRNDSEFIQHLVELVAAKGSTISKFSSHVFPACSVNISCFCVSQIVFVYNCDLMRIRPHFMSNQCNCMLLACD